MKKIVLLFSVAMMTLTARGQTINANAVSTYYAPGVNVSLNDNFTLPALGTNNYYVSWTVSNTDTVLIISPNITNGYLRVKNTSVTNTPNYFTVGNNGTNYTGRVHPGEVYTNPGFVLDGSMALHGISSNGVQSAQVQWVPTVEP